MIRHRGGAIRRRGDHSIQPESSPVLIGSLLRSTRERNGLDLLTVHDQIGRPITQLEALEAGEAGALPDQAAALATLRRYGSFLGLDGDSLVVQMVEAWSAAPLGVRRRQTPRELDHPTMSSVVTAISSGPEHLRAFTQTGPVPAVSGAGSATGSISAFNANGFGYGGSSGPPTGMLTVIPREEIRATKQARRRARRRRRAAWPLKLLTWLVLVAVIAAGAGLAADRWRPQWLVRWHVLRLASPGTGPSSSNAVPIRSASNPGSSGFRASRSSPVALVSSGSNGSDYSVDASDFSVVIATSGPCWIQVSSPATAKPSSQGVQQAHQVTSYKASRSLAVQVGSSAVVLGVVIRGKDVFVAHPSSAPYTYTFTSR